MNNLITCFIFTLLFTILGCKKDSFKNDNCNLEGKAGPCLGLLPGYYYNKQEKKCVEFIWGGCEGVRPFATMEDCEKSCHCK